VTYYLRHGWRPGCFITRFECVIATILVHDYSDVNIVTIGKLIGFYQKSVSPLSLLLLFMLDVLLWRHIEWEW
jgi:hypothetical protein